MYTVAVELITKDNISHWYTRDLINVQCSENSKDADLTPQPGVIEQNASLKIYDRESYFKYNIMKSTANFFRGCALNVYIRKGITQVAVCSESLACNETVTCDEGTTYVQSLIGSYLVDKVQMEGDSDEVSISCIDLTNILSSIKIEQYPLADRTIDDFLNIIFGEFLNGATWEYTDDATQDICENTFIPDSFITGTDARAFLDQVCTCGMLNIFQVNGNYQVMRSIQGNFVINEYLKLTPSYYDKELKWDLNIKNQIDTVTFTAYDKSMDPTEVMSQIVNNFVHKSNEAFTLPAKSSVEAGTFIERETYTMLGKGRTSYYSNGPSRCSKGYVGCWMGTAEFDITVPEPLVSISGTPSYKGITKYTSSFSWGDFQNPDQGGFHIRDIISLVDSKNPSTSSEWVDQSNYVEYTNVAGINVNPYVKNVHKAKSEATPSPAEDTITKWTGSNHTGTWWSSTTHDYWVGEYWNDDNTRYGSSPSKVAMWPSMFYTASGMYTGLSKAQQKIKCLREGRLKPSVTLTKIDDYHYHVKMYVPTFYCYIAYTEENWADLYVVVVVEKGWQRFDSLAFYDQINEISLKISGYRYTEIENNYSYSLDANNNLTLDLINNSVFKFPKSQLITERTTVNGVSWRDSVALSLLRNYKKGRYVVTVDVNATWCIEHGVKVNTPIMLKLPNNEYLSKIDSNSDVYDYNYTIEYSGSVWNQDSKEYLIMLIPLNADGTRIMLNGNQTVTLWRKDSTTQYLTAYNTFNNIRKIEFEGGYAKLYSINIFGEFVLEEQIDNSRLEHMLNNGGIGFFFGETDYIEGSTNIINQAIPNGAHVNPIIVNAIDSPVIFQVKNITKKFEKNKYVYQLKLIEEKLQALLQHIVYETVTSFNLNREYVFSNDISISTNIARLDMRANKIRIRLRYKDSLIVFRDYYVGRVVINRDANELVTYTWVSGSTFRAYERFDLTSLAIQNFIVTMDLEQGIGTQYNLSEFYPNIIGYIEEE